MVQTSAESCKSRRLRAPATNATSPLRDFGDPRSTYPRLDMAVQQRNIVANRTDFLWVATAEENATIGLVARPELDVEHEILIGIFGN